MSLPRLLIIGAGRHAAVVIEALRAIGGFSIAGAIDPGAAQQEVLGVPVLGGEDLLPGLRQSGIGAAVVALGSNLLRARIGEMLSAQGFALPHVIHPSACISPTAVIEHGAVVMARAVLGTCAYVGPLAIINTGAIIDHDGNIAAAAHVAPGVVLAGNVVVGERALVGVGSAVRPGIRIGADAVIGAGSAVVSDIEAGVVIGGVPARPLRREGRALP